MAATFVSHRVADYDAWRAVYDSVGEMQAAAGVTDKGVYRLAGDPDNVLVYHRFGSMDQAKTFFDDPNLRAAMKEAGVDESSLRIEFYDEA
jgi:hypothetical protein